MEGYDYKPNSNKYKEEQKQLPAEKKKLESVVSSPVQVKKKSELGKLSGIFISKDVHSIMDYIWMDVIVPAIKNAVEDTVTNGIRMLLRGETAARKSSSSGGSKVSYQKYYDDRRGGDRFANETTRVKRTYEYDSIIFNSRGDAEAALDRLLESCERYGMVTVGDLYDVAQVTGSNTDYKYGWTSLRNAKVVHVREGYIIELPMAMPID